MNPTIFIIVFLALNAIFTATGEQNKVQCAHCIKKREAVNWCTAKGCTTCVGSFCRVSCKGFGCGNCPDGNCCNSRNCNACYNDTCCKTPSCNYCMSACRQTCSNATACLNTCSQQCPTAPHDVFIVPSKVQNNGKEDVTVYIKGVPHKGQVTSGTIPNENKTAIVTVDGTDHMAIILSVTSSSCQKGTCVPNCANNPINGKCCSNIHCSNCYENCSSNCQTGESCLTACSNKCSNHVNGRNQTFIYNNPTINRFNVSTVINITNIINNTNVIDSPIFMNNTNLNNFTLPYIAPNESQRIIYQNYYQQLQRGCCHVVHPPQCFNNHMYPYQHCFRRSHQECSNLCTSQFIHLISNPSPQPHHQNRCHYIRSYPYIYCGQHSVQNCDSCYVCNGQYNPNVCMRQPGCSDICRQSLLPPNLPTLQQGQPNVPISQPRHGSYRLVYPGTPEYQQILEYLQRQRNSFRDGAALQYG